ncbi:DEAD/DEAH box helicase [Kitasatospora sp. NBC_01287]|uniref:DEAD/DEAH box helicase n=1 Tax=Kitasatospora sp. NBC_01287 TaxID=2903573 RepID=UPI0022513BC1|nr:DEAD/DEAH box helicase [Kitasatospora sp. NBC_01287]MCX4747478.1 DEAD/DEAH box helicase [Kitasatospora sp. NBC_01287]
MSLVDDDRFVMPASAQSELIGQDEALDAATDLIDTDSLAAFEADEAIEAGDTAETETAEAEPTITFGDLGLHDDVVRALAKRGVTTPFPIQAATIPDALAGKDVLGRGRTGSGKTLSFGLPLLTRLADGERTKPKHPRGLILVPTRELAMQVADALEPFGSVLGLKLKVVCGGTSMSNQIYALERGVDVLVATPGRLRDLINRGTAKLADVQTVVLDEADQMADMGFLPEVTEILDQVPAGGQRLLFSATLENEIDSLVKRYLSNPVTHEVDAAQGAVTTMSHHILVVKPKDKAPITNAIAARKGRTIIFVRTQMGADRVAEQLIEAGVKADALHGGMTQGARTRVLGDFKDGYVNVVVATDVAARGIHVDGIDLVLNVDPAGDHKDYLHRSGRTARAGRSGAVVTLVLPHQRRGVFRLMEDAGVDASRHILDHAFDAEVAKITGARSLVEVQAESASGIAGAAEREVAEMSRQLERAQRRATELREEADRLSARAARERAELGIEDEAPAAEAVTEGAEAVAAQAAEVAPVREVREPREERTPAYREARNDRPSFGDRGGRDRDDRGGRSSGDRDNRGGFGGGRDRDDRPARSFGDRDNRGGFGGGRDRDDRGGRSFGDRPARSFGDRDNRGGFGGGRDRDDRPARSFGDRDNRDNRGGFGGGRDRDDRGGRSFGDRPARSFGDRDNRGGFGGGRDRDDRPARSFGDRPARSFGDRDNRGGSGSGNGGSTSRPFARRDDHRSGGRPQGGSFGGDRDRGGFGGGRSFGDRDNRGGSGSGGGFNGGDRKPRWKN